MQKDDMIYRQAAIDALNTGFWGVEWDKALATAILKDLPPAQPEQRWIPVSERLPEEHESMFARFYGSERWSRSMWLRQSDRVIVTSELADGTRITETATTRDGEWKPDHTILKREIVAWMPLPEPYKGETI